jgi:aromatic ring-cleaving dioxygenase
MRFMTTTPTILDFHAHIYFDPAQVDLARSLATQAASRFALLVGRFHVQQVGPHPRGSCQLTVSTQEFGAFTAWLALNRGDLTVFAHANTGDDWADHTHHVIWFGPSERLNPAFFGRLKSHSSA